MEVFSYLDHGDLLQTRTVCQRWNNAISHWTGFLDKVTFILRRSPAHNSFPTLSRSRVPWKSITLTNFTHEKVPSWYFPAHISDSLTALNLKEGKLTWTWMRDVTGRFQQLETFSILKCERVLEEDEGWNQTTEQEAKFSEFQRRVKHLSVETNNTRTLNFYLRQFICSDSTLASLFIKIQREPEVGDHGFDRHFKDFNMLTITFYDLIRSCSSTLKCFSLDTYDRFAVLICWLFNYMEWKTNRLDLKAFHLQWKWEEAWDYLGSQVEEFYLSFLKTQHNVKYLTLPRLERRNVEPGGQLLSALPRKLTNMFQSEDSNLTVEVFKHLHTLKVMVIKFERENSFIESMDNKIYPELRELTVHGKVTGLAIPPIVAGFPNLVKLSVSCSRSVQDELQFEYVSISDDKLQLIVQSLPHLRILSLSPCDLITDFGVSGVFRDDCLKLMDSRTLYLGQKLSFFEIEQPGRPLCSLRCKAKTIDRCNGIWDEAV